MTDIATISWLSIIAVDSFIVGGLVQALIVINDATYTPERWQGTLLTWVAVIAVASFNIFCAKHLPLAEGIFCSVHIFSFVPVIVCLWVMTPTKQSASAVFTQFTDNGAGWPNMGATVLVGQVGFPNATSFSRTLANNRTPRSQACSWCSDKTL
jgi:choline transport protein